MSIPVAPATLTCFPNMRFHPLDCLPDALGICDIQQGGVEAGGGDPLEEDFEDPLCLCRRDDDD